jgi:putative SOS response-associated peptidase YedK
VKEDGTAAESCVHITMPANELMANIHNTGNNPHRMPAILRAEDREAWLSGTPQEARAVLRQYRADLMDAYEVSTRSDPLRPVRHRDCVSGDARRWRDR